MAEDRLIETPFLRLSDGYQLVVPLDLLLTVRHHLLRFAHQENELEELGRRYRAAALRRVERLLPRGVHRKVLSEGGAMSRYLFSVDSATDVHVIVATDTLTDWSPEHLWGMYNTSAVLGQIGDLIRPDVRTSYSTAEWLLHLVITDSPGRSLLGRPERRRSRPCVDGAVRRPEVMLHREPDGALGLLFFAEAQDRRPGESMTTNILDEYSVYEDSKKSFYFSDDGMPTFTVFQAGDGFFEREKFFEETTDGGGGPRRRSPMAQARRRYSRDTPEIFILDSTCHWLRRRGRDHPGLRERDLGEEPSPDAAVLLLESVAFWIRECIVRRAHAPGTEEPLGPFARPRIDMESPWRWPDVGASHRTRPEWNRRVPVHGPLRRRPASRIERG